MMEEKSIDLRGLNVPGMIRFTIRADDTEYNENIHSGFKEFCKVECRDDYTEGLRRLLEAYQSDFKYELLFDRITLLEERIVQLEQANTTKEEKTEEENTGVF